MAGISPRTKRSLPDVQGFDLANADFRTATGQTRSSISRNPKRVLPQAPGGVRLTELNTPSPRSIAGTATGRRCGAVGRGRRHSELPEKQQLTCSPILHA